MDEVHHNNQNSWNAISALAPMIHITLNDTCQLATLKMRTDQVDWEWDTGYSNPFLVILGGSLDTLERSYTNISK